MHHGECHRRHFIALAAACAATPLAAQTSGLQRKLLVMGDSLSAEYGIARGSGWVEILQQRLNARKQQTITVVNASISGETTSGGLARLPALLEQHQPQWLIIALGSNDALRGLSLQHTRSNLQKMVDAGKKIGSRIVLAGMQMPPNYGARYAQQFADIYPELAKENKTALAPFLLKDVADAPNAAELFQADRLHPLAVAQPQIFQNIWPALNPLLN